MSRTIKIAPVRKSIVVDAPPHLAFEVFTTGIDRWWPRTHGIGNGPIEKSFFEPRLGGRWYAKYADGSEATVGHVLDWSPGERLIVTWEIDATWKSDPRPAYTSELEVTFSPEGKGKTRIDLEHRNFERMGDAAGQTMRGHVDRGWPGLLELFAADVKRNEP